MARRRSARSQPDLDDEDDDEFAWQPKKSSKKKSKKKKGTGRTSRTSESGKRKRTKTGSTGRSAKSTGSTRRSSKSTGSRKTSGSSINRSGRKKKSRGDSDETMGSSSRRRRSGRTPPRKKQGVSPVVLISIITGALLLCAIVIVWSNRGQGEDGVNEPAQLERADAIAAEGMDVFKDWSRAREKGSASQDSLNAKAHGKLTKAMDIYNEVLDPYRDGDGQLPTKYSGYEPAMQQIAIYLVDLEKGARMGH